MRLLAFVAVNHSMWAIYCHNGFVKALSTKWPFIYMLGNFSVSTLEVHHCSVHHSLLFSCILAQSHVHPPFNPTSSGSCLGGRFHSPLAYSSNPCWLLKHAEIIQFHGCQPIKKAPFQSRDTKLAVRSEFLSTKKDEMATKLQ